MVLVPLNFASEPFRRDRAMLVASAAVGLLLVALLAVLINLAGAERGRAAENRRALALLERRLVFPAVRAFWDTKNRGASSPGD